MTLAILPESMEYVVCRMQPTRSRGRLVSPKKTAVVGPVHINMVRRGTILKLIEYVGSILSDVRWDGRLSIFALNSKGME